MYRNTYALIDKNILKNNVKNIISTYSYYKYYFGVVKGNAYGHGYEIINSLIEGGINYLCVATLDEAIEIRKFNKNIPILCLEPIDLKFIDLVINNNITITICSYDYFLELSDLSTDETIKAHIKIDSGMHRLGIKSSNELREILNYKSNIYIEGIYTHFATAGTYDNLYNKQVLNFNSMLSAIDISKIDIIHADRSLTMVRHNKLNNVNGVRLGICMYGFAQSTSPPNGINKIKAIIRKYPKNVIYENNLKVDTAISLFAPIIALEDVKKGEFVGYGAKYIANHDIKVATIAIGYYDGFKQGIQFVSINNIKCPLIGECCMDMIMVEIPECLYDKIDVDIHAKKNDKITIVEIFGKNISLKSICTQCSSNAYKVLTGISDRVSRIYK